MCFWSSFCLLVFNRIVATRTDHLIPKYRSVLCFLSSHIVALILPFETDHWRWTCGVQMTWMSPSGRSCSCQSQANTSTLMMIRDLCYFMDSVLMISCRVRVVVCHADFSLHDMEENTIVSCSHPASRTTPKLCGWHLISGPWDKGGLGFSLNYPNTLRMKCWLMRLN